jgi:hypothetical protein
LVARLLSLKADSARAKQAAEEAEILMKTHEEHPSAAKAFFILLHLRHD